MAANVIVSGSERRYADAAFAVAGESGDYDAWMNALDELARVIAMPTARLALTSPAVSGDEKRGTIEKLVPNQPPMLRNFLHILVERDRLSQLPGIASAFRERVNRERGVITADVTTAIPLDPELERDLAQRLGRHTRHDPQKIQIRARVDPEIIGGVVARIGDTLIDDSVRGRLERLRRTLAEGRR